MTTTGTRRRRHRHYDHHAPRRRTRRLADRSPARAPACGPLPSGSRGTGLVTVRPLAHHSVAEQDEWRATSPLLHRSPELQVPCRVHGRPGTRPPLTRYDWRAAGPGCCPSVRTPDGSTEDSPRSSSGGFYAQLDHRLHMPASWEKVTIALRPHPGGAHRESRLRGEAVDFGLEFWRRLRG